MDAPVLLLPRMFAPDEALVSRIALELSQLTHGPTLSKKSTLTPKQVSIALDVAFWSSLGSNEGRPTQARLLFADPELLPGPIRFASSVPYEPHEVSKLAPAIPEGGCLCVAPADDAMRVWGMHHTDPGSSLHALGLWLPLPGVVHVRIGALRPYAVVSEGRASLLADAAVALPDQLRLRLGKSLTGGDIRKAQLAWRECLLLAALARRVLHHGHGGTLLIVGDEDGAWRSAVDIAHRFAEPDVSLRDALRRGLGAAEGAVPRAPVASSPSMPEAMRWQVVGPSALHLAEEAAALRRVAPYAAVDGAVVITRELAVLGFGAKILVSGDATTHVLMAGPQAPVTSANAHPLEDTGGTRHQSAARFVGAHHEAVAIVISHDGHIALFFWDADLGSARMIRNVDWWD